MRVGLTSSFRFGSVLGFLFWNPVANFFGQQKSLEKLFCNKKFNGGKKL